MPIYEYEHIGDHCRLGRRFEIMQSIMEHPLEKCPECGGYVKKLISFAYISTPKSNRELRELGFTKLVRRDDGVYENVTARGKDRKLMLRDKPETSPDFSQTVSD